jgi:hypothetical protein
LTISVKIKIRYPATYIMKHQKIKGNDKTNASYSEQLVNIYNVYTKEKGLKSRSRTKLGQTTQWPKENNKRTNNDLQSTTQKTKDRATRTPLKSGCELSCAGKVCSSCAMNTNYSDRNSIHK